MGLNIFKSKVAKNASWIIGCKIVQSIMSVVVTMISARYLGPSNYGLINYAASITSFVLPIALLGIANVEVQELVNNPDDEGKIVGTSIFLSEISALFCILGIFAFTSIANAGEKDTIIVCVLYGTTLLFEATQLIVYWYQANFLSKYSSIVSFIAYIIVAAYKIVLLITGVSIYYFAISTALDTFLISLLLIIIYKRKSKNKIRISSSIAKDILKKSVHYIIPNMMIAIFTQTDQIMIKLMLGDEANGLYSSALVCAGMLGFVFGAIVDSFRPLIFINFKESNEKFEDTIVSLYSIINYSTILLGIGFTIFAPIVIKILYGDEFISASNTLRVTCWLTFLSNIGTIRNIWILANNKQKYLWILNMTGALLNIALNIVLINYIGIIGAAVSSVFTQFFVNIIMTFVFKPYRRTTILFVKGMNPKNLLKFFK